MVLEVNNLPNVLDVPLRRGTGKRSIKTRRKMSESHKGVPLSVEHRASISKGIKILLAKPEIKLKLLRGQKRRFANMGEDEWRIDSIRKSYPRLRIKPDFTLSEALKMSLLEYIVRLMDFREVRFRKGHFDRLIIESVYPERNCVLCDNKAEDTHHITGNKFQHGKGRVLWVVPLCCKHHGIATYQLNNGIHDLANRFYKIALQHQLPEGIEIDIMATRNISFEEALTGGAGL